MRGGQGADQALEFQGRIQIAPDSRGTRENVPGPFDSPLIAADALAETTDAQLLVSPTMNYVLLCRTVARDGFLSPYLQ